MPSTHTTLPSPISSFTSLGPSPLMRVLSARLSRYAQTEAAILVQGETGAGKEVVARAIHQLSPRSQGDFIAVNCGAIPGELVESELFGTVLGAFTGARTRRGWFSMADRGTLFLDELGDLPLPSQAALLRTLETGVIWPVGGESPHHVDIRLVCATHRPLIKMVAQGTFREDLYHRISTLNVVVPPLRQRVDDMPYLLQTFFGDRLHDVSPEAWRKIEAYAWPGNVREFRNVLTRAFIHASPGTIKPSHLQWMEPSVSTQQELEHTRPLHLVIADYVSDALRQNGGNVRATARALSISPTTVYRYLACRPEPERV